MKLKKYFRIIIWAIIASLFFCFTLEIKNIKERLFSVEQTNKFIVDENDDLRIFAFELCQNINFFGEQFSIGSDDCTQFFPELAVSNATNQNDKELIISFVDTFLINENETVNLQEKIFEFEKMELHEQDTEERSQEIIKSFYSLFEDENIIKYFNDYNIDISTSSKDVFILKSDDREIKIYYDKSKKKVFANFSLQKAKKLSLNNFLDKKNRAEFVLDEFTEFDMDEFLASVEKIKNKQKVGENYLILGKNGANVDTIILANVNDLNKKITLISIPRDLFVDSRKINSYFHYLGMSAFVKKIEKITGQKISHYVMVDMMIFPELVDKIGGIDFKFDTALVDPTYRTVDEGVEGTLYFSEGTQHLNGIQALRVARSRHTTNDFSRAERQQKIIKAINNKVDDIGGHKVLMKIVPEVFKKVNTDLNFYVSIPLILRIKDYDIEFGNVMSVANILESKMLELKSGQKMYILEPKEKDWTLIEKFILQKINE